MSPANLVHQKVESFQTFDSVEELQAYFEGLVTPRVSTQRQERPAIEGVEPPKRGPNYSARPAADRIADRVARVESGCLLWTGPRNNCEYGRARIDGQAWQMHRLVWTLHFGLIPQGLVVMHLCDTPPCIEIDHLVLGTQAANVFDRDQKGRGVTP